MRQVGATAFPSAVLVDPQGNIAYVGHPARITDEMVKSVLDGALSVPVYEWPKDCEKVAKALRKGKLADAVKGLAKIEEDHPEIAESVRGMVTGRVRSLERAAEEGDWLRVETLGADLSKALKKLPEGERVDEILKDLKGNKDAQAVLKAQKKVAKLVEGPIKKAKYDRVKKDLQKIRDAFEGTAAERDARAALEKIKESKRR